MEQYTNLSDAIIDKKTTVIKIMTNPIIIIYVMIITMIPIIISYTGKHILNSRMTSTGKRKHCLFRTTLSSILITIIFTYVSIYLLFYVIEKNIVKKKNFII